VASRSGGADFRPFQATPAKNRAFSVQPAGCLASAAAPGPANPAPACRAAPERPTGILVRRLQAGRVKLRRAILGNRMQPLKTMRGRLIAVIVAVLAVAFSATLLVSYRITWTALKQGVVERELPLTGDTIYSEIQADLVRPINVSSQMAYDTFLRDWVIDGELDEAPLRRYLNEIRQQYGFFTAFYISENTRRYYHFTGISKVLKEDESRDVWFFRVRDMAADYEINVDPNQQQDDKITIFINHRVQDYAGNFIGVTGVGLESDTMAAIMDRYGAMFGRHVYFAERSGRITLHPDLDVAYRRNLADMPGMAAIADKVLQSNSGAFEYETEDGIVLLTTRYIPELDWMLMVEQRESSATAGAGTGLIGIVLIGIAAIVFTTLTIAWAINRVQDRLEQMATLDPLTGLYNRQVFDLALTKAVERARRNKLAASLILIDLDHFKPTNDRFGHLVGDRILKALARLLQHSVRRSDVLARWGGEEFAVLMENCGEPEAKRAAELLRQRIADDLRLDDLPDARTTASLGVATLGPHDTVDDLFARADAALYAAKKAGRNRVAGASGIVDANASQRQPEDRAPQLV
jgi:diguanylate cyclase (GGDEF)-like protein